MLFETVKDLADGVRSRKWILGDADAVLDVGVLHAWVALRDSTDNKDDWSVLWELFCERVHTH